MADDGGKKNSTDMELIRNKRMLIIYLRLLDILIYSNNFLVKLIPSIPFILITFNEALLKIIK